MIQQPFKKTDDSNNWVSNYQVTINKKSNWTLFFFSKGVFFPDLNFKDLPVMNFLQSLFLQNYPVSCTVIDSQNVGIYVASTVFIWWLEGT